MASKEKARQPRTPEPVPPGAGGEDRSTARGKDNRDSGAGASSGQDRGAPQAPPPARRGGSTPRR